MFVCFDFFSHTICVASLPRATPSVHTVHMADTGRSRHTLGVSVTVTVFLCLRDQTWVKNLSVQAEACDSLNQGGA